MNQENAGILENLTHTLLYEGYALYPYHRSAIKNQKPVPFGVVFPEDYTRYNEFAHSTMQTQCIITGSGASLINISVRFLHLIKIELFEHATSRETPGEDYIPVYDLNINDRSYQAGWQTIERQISTTGLKVSQLINNPKVITLEFDKMSERKNIVYEDGKIAAKQINTVAKITGTVIIEATPLESIQNSFRITVKVTNKTPVEKAELITRDEGLCQSFLSTHTIIETPNAQFISHQDPGEKWRAAVTGCKNINTWPILIDADNTTLLSSPIILYDYPMVNPQSHGDLFDSTEIEEALLLHVNLLSDEEKKRIALGDEKLNAMLNKVSQLTPEELINFHSGLKQVTEDQAIHTKKSGI